MVWCSLRRLRPTFMPSISHTSTKWSVSTLRRVSGSRERPAFQVSSTHLMPFAAAAIRSRRLTSVASAASFSHLEQSTWAVPAQGAQSATTLQKSTLLSSAHSSFGCSSQGRTPVDLHLRQVGASGVSSS